MIHLHSNGCLPVNNLNITTPSAHISAGKGSYLLFLDTISGQM